MLDGVVLDAKPSSGVGICIIESPDLACPIEAYVSVMRIHRVGPQYLLGLRFESIGDEQLHVIQAYESLWQAQNAKRVADPLAGA